MINNVDQGNQEVVLYLVDKFGNCEECGNGTLEYIHGFDQHSNHPYNKLVVYKHPHQEIPDISELKRFILNPDRNSQSKILLEVEISPEIVFKQQQNLVLQWTSHEYEIVVKFGNQEFFEKINNVIKVNIGDYSITVDDFDPVNISVSSIESITDDTLSSLYNELSQNPQTFRVVHSFLVKPELINELYEKYNECKNRFFESRQHIAKSAEEPEEMEEEDEEFEKLENQFLMMCGLIKHLIFSGNEKLYPDLLSDQYYFKTFEAIEIINNLERGTLTNFLAKTAVLKHIDLTKDEAIDNLINLNYRLGFLKDSIMQALTDDFFQSKIYTIIQNNAVEILKYFINRESFIKLSNSILKNNEYTESALTFLYEMISLLKSPAMNPELSHQLTQLKSKFIEEIYAAQMQQKIFKLLDMYLPIQQVVANNQLKNIVFLSVELLFFLSVSDSGKFIENFAEDQMEVFMELLKCDVLGLQVHVVETLKNLITTPQPFGDFMILPRQTPANDFLKKILPLYFKILCSKDLEEKYLEAILQEFVSLIDKALDSSLKKTRDFILHKKVILVVWEICEQYTDHPRRKYLLLSYFKLVKVFLKIKDDMLVRSLLQHNFCSNTIKVLYLLKKHDNLLSSVCLDILYYISIENFSKIIDSFAKMKSEINEKKLEKQFEKIFEKFAFNSQYDIERKETFDSEEEQELNAAEKIIDKREKEALEEEEFFDVIEELPNIQLSAPSNSKFLPPPYIKKTDSNDVAFGPKKPKEAINFSFSIGITNNNTSDPMKPAEILDSANTLDKRSTESFQDNCNRKQTHLC